MRKSPHSFVADEKKFCAVYQTEHRFVENDSILRLAYQEWHRHHVTRYSFFFSIGEWNVLLVRFALVW
jgi:hypothetical protein